MLVFRTEHWGYVLHAFQGDDIQRRIQDNIGATISQITSKDMKAFRHRRPPEDEQAPIAEVLTDMNAEPGGVGAAAGELPRPQAGHDARTSDG